MKTVYDITEYIGKHIRMQPKCIETGCMYVCPPGNEVHTTTNNIIYNICKPLSGSLVSFEIDEEHIDYAASFVGNLALLEFEYGDSVEHIASHFKNCMAGKIDLACFDSKEFDPDHMVNEFNAALPYFREAHYILVDDTCNPSSVKADKMVPILKASGYEWREVNTPTGMFVAAKGYPLW